MRSRALPAVVGVMLFLLLSANAALVEPSGYTNDFGSLPPATDWATTSRPGSSPDAYEPDADVNGAITAANVTAQLGGNTNNPPPASTNATWTSSGLCIQTRPTLNRYTALMGKFVNNTGTNASEIAWSYAHRVTAGGAAEDSQGLRFYYSLHGGPETWTNVPALNSTIFTNSLWARSHTLALEWTNGAALYFLWVDDNGTTGTDAANQIDDFSLRVTAGLSVSTLLAARLTTPTNAAVFPSGDAVQATTAVWLGTPPYRVEYFTNVGAGNLAFVSAGTSGIAPFDLSLGQFTAGAYSVYAAVSDSTEPPLTATTATNTFVVADPISIELTSPAAPASIDHLTPVTGVAAVTGGTGPYRVQFHLNESPVGPVITTPPYQYDFGVLFVGEYTLWASVTDAHGWRSDSAVHPFRVTGPLAVTLSPTNGQTFYEGEPVVLDARIGGGTGPYTVTFYTNGEPAGVLTTAPFALQLGALAPGSYTGVVHVADSSAPAGEAWSTTNIFRVEWSYLFAFLWEPADGAMLVEGIPADLSGYGYVEAPLTLDRVEFFYNGALAAVATSASATGTLTNHVRGPGEIYAVVVDSAGRRAYSETNRVEVLAGGRPPNDDFSNAIALSGPGGSLVGHNFLATRQPNEPSVLGNRGGASVWWAWTPSTSGLATIDTFGSDFDTLLGVYTGSALGQLTLVAQNDDSQSVQSRVQFNAVAGRVYWIVVDGFAFSGMPDRGVIRLNVRGAGGLRLDFPTNNAVFTVGDPIPVEVTILSDFPNPPPTRVEFYLNNNAVVSVTNAPFSAVITNAPLGSNTLHVVAVDSAGGRLASGVLQIFVQKIGVMILTPRTFTSYYEPVPIPITAWAYAPDGVITNVAFFVGDLRIGEDATFPYGTTWTNVTGGSHRIVARAWASTGRTYQSDPVNIGVAHLFVPLASEWRYLDNGSDQGTNWTGLDYDDSGWAAGRAPLGYGDSQGRLPATSVSPGPTGGSRYATTYFRRSVVITNLAGLNWLDIGIERDDGAIVYVNGVEVGRFNLPSGPITHTNYAATAADDGAFAYYIYPPRSVFREGTNVVAVEIHQDSPAGGDLWFQMELIGLPRIISNLQPVVFLSSPTNQQYFLGPPSVTLEAEAFDGDGTITKVEFFADEVKLGESTNAPYRLTWAAPPIGPHRIIAVAHDDFGDSTISQEASIVVYDGVGTPFAAITSPGDGAVRQGPTNLAVTAAAFAITGVTNVQFLANDVEFGSAATAPYAATWDAPFGTNQLRAVASDANGTRGTSAVVTVTITIPPTNVVAPAIFGQAPAGGATVTNLTNVVVTFSENVQNVDAADLLINGVPAAGVNASHSRSNYTFRFPAPPYGRVEVTWAEGHGITDYGWPSVLPFDESGPGATWSYTFVDAVPPAIAARAPAPGSAVTALEQISVTFTEPVSGVDAADLQVNGTPALEVAGAGASYTFRVVQPPMGTVSVTWATNHGIFDLAGTPNAFNRTAPGAAWSFLLDTRTLLVQSNSFWRFAKGTTEASSPIDAWRQPAFDDSGWSNSPAPFFFGDPYGSPENSGTLLDDMFNNYFSVYLRKEFHVANRALITNLWLNAQSDDGFIAWLNGIEIHRYNAPVGEPYHDAMAGGVGPEPQGRGAAFLTASLPNAVAALVNGRNILAVQGFNQAAFSSDFGFNAEFYTFVDDPRAVAPQVLQISPPPGDVMALTNLTFVFSEPVSGVAAEDLLVNGMPADQVSTETNTTYTFSFGQPPYGPVSVTWSAGHGIADFDEPPKTFVPATVSYALLNPSSPRIASRAPAADAALTALTELLVTFTEPVSGLEASDLLVSGSPAASVTTDNGVTYRFSFVQPPYGLVTIRWATNHGIVDLEAGIAFDPTRFNAQWNYTLIDPAPSVTLTSPTNGTFRLAPADVTLAATATDDGAVVRVEFYADGNRLGESAAAPYSFAWSNIVFGTYVLRAVATDNLGFRGTSAPVVLNVVTSLPAFLVRGPYLQVGTETSGVVRWRTDVATDGVVLYGTEPDHLTNAVSHGLITNEHIVQVTGLLPDTQYYYSIGSAAQRLAGTNGFGSEYWFRTSPATGARKPTRLWVLGDAGTAGNGSPARQASTRDAFYNYAATNGPPDLWLMLGDNAYNSGTDAEYQRAVFDMYPATLRNKFLWPTLGNHETGQATTINDFPYLRIFSLPTQGEAGGVPSGTEKYYSFDYANIHFVSLDSMTSGRTGTSAMAEWLRLDLAAATAEWIIVFFHHPPYTKGSHNSDVESDLVAIRENLVPIMEDGGVDLVLSGHSHCWERSYLIDRHYGLSQTFTESMKVNAGDGREGSGGAYQKNFEGRGVVYTVAGSSGQASGGPLNHPAHYLSLNELGSMVIEVNGNRLAAAFLNANGSVQDQFTLLKPDQAPVAPMNLLAFAMTASEARLQWTDIATNELGYLLERSQDGTNFVEWLGVAANVGSVVDTGLVANATYYYRVRGTNLAGFSDYSNIASVTAVHAVSRPEPPGNFQAASRDGSNFYRSHMRLVWEDRSTDEAGFVIERSRDSGPFVPVTTVPAGATSFLDPRLESATLYSYRVRAFNLIGESDWSTPASDQTHPQSQTVRAGQSVSFHAGGEGGPDVRYQWRFANAVLVGETNETLTITNATLSHQGEYRVAIDTGAVVLSNPATLAVVSEPFIVSQPQDLVIGPGLAAEFSVTVEGTPPFSYQWLRNNLPIGSDAPDFRIPSAQFSDAGGYDVLVQNAYGSVASRLATLSVYAFPSLAPVPDFFAEVLKPLAVTNVAIDPNTPRLQLRYALGPGAPTNAYLNPETGLFLWAPSRGQAPSTNLIQVRVSDIRNPALGASGSFTVFVNHYAELTAGSLVMLAGTNGALPLNLFSSVPLTEFSCTIQLPAERFNSIALEELFPERASAVLEMAGADLGTLRLRAQPGHVLHAGELLAQLRLGVAAEATSGFVPVRVASPRATLAGDAAAPTLLAADGQVTILGTQALLEAQLVAGRRQLMFYGRPGVTYTIEYSTNALGSGPWRGRGVVIMTNLVRAISIGNQPPTNVPVIFRARH